MKRILIVGVLLSLSACASWYGKDSNSGHNKLVNESEPRQYDDAYISAVNRDAKQKGVVVLWVHPPKAPKPEVAKRDNQ